MKPTVSILITALLALIVSDARAQDASIPLNVEAASEQVRRTPALVVREVVTPPSPAKPTIPAPNSQGASTKTTASKSTAAEAPSPVPQRPIVLESSSPSVPAEMATTGNPKYDELIAQSAARHGVDPNLVVAVMRQESGFNYRARSYKGATGLMQLMPATAARMGVRNIYDPAQNIEGGTKYLRFLMDHFNGDVKLALAGYNAGENAVINSGYRIPRYRETQNYVRSISARYNVNKSSARPVAVGQVAAPAAAVFSTGASSGRLSNNY